MSLILEALRKLERDRPQAGEGPNVVLLAPRPWPEVGDGRGRRLWIVAASVGALLVLGLAALFVWWLASRSTPGPAAGARPDDPPAPVAVAPQTPAPLALTAATPASAASTAARPPASSRRPLPHPTPPVFHLTAIGDQDGHPVAVLNDRVLRVGDALEGAQIVRIGDASVELRFSDGRLITVGF